VSGDLELLREIYLHLKRSGFLGARKERQARVEALFRKLAALLGQASGTAPVPLILHVDGASRGNPGMAGAGGVVLTEDGVALDEFALSLGVCTNNEAEYQALIEGLRRVSALNPSKLTVRSDSLLLVRQMRGEFRIKKHELVLLHLEARKHLPKCPVTFEHVPREENREADRLANLGIDRARGEAPAKS
jgi:ribonuclease HI